MKTDVNPLFAAIVAEVGGLDVAEVLAEKAFIEDLDIDSLSLVEISAQVEDELHVTVPQETLFTLRTVGEFSDYVSAGGDPLA